MQTNHTTLPLNTKCYTTHARACKYGNVRGASPIIDSRGLEMWVAERFYNSKGEQNSYSLASNKILNNPVFD